MTPNAYYDLYRNTLFNDVLPFWMKYSYDEKTGALNNCLSDEGKLLSNDKYLWSQGRALWTFSASVRRMQAGNDWLNRADMLFEYLLTHGRNDNGHWNYRLDGDGNVLDGDTSIYVDGYILHGLSEYIALTKDERAVRLAQDTYRKVLQRLSNPSGYNLQPYQLKPGTKVFGVRMLFGYVFNELSSALNNDEMFSESLKLTDEMLHDFYDANNHCYREIINCDGSIYSEPEGGVCVPGHVLEGMWFALLCYQRAGDKDKIQRCIEMIKRHIELAWDDEFGGLRLALDMDGRDSVAWQKADCKPWWAQVEALVATAFAYKYTQEQWCLDWHEKIRQFAFAHYPAPAGEWTQWLDRQGNKTTTAALPVKDPYHLPRALITLCETWK